MENSYGIGVCNRYELFYDEDADPLDLVVQSKKIKDKTAEKENKVVDKKVKSVAPKESIKGENKATEDKTQQSDLKPKSSKVGRNNETARVKFSDREERNNRRNRPEGGEEKHTTTTTTTQKSFDDERGRGGKSNFPRGGVRGSRGTERRGRGEFRGKREFDRQSGMVGSGVKAVDKRDGSGSYNWGSDKDQITEEQREPADLDTSGENAEKPATEENATLDEEALKLKEEEEAAQKEMTLDEWKALQKREKPVFKTRRAGEGENNSQWKKTYVLKKKVEEKSSEEESDEDDDDDIQHGRKKVLLPIDFQFSDTPMRGRGRGRGRGGRGMGGGPRGGRGMGRGGPRGGRGQGFHRQEAPKMDNEKDFPSLG